MKLIIVMLLTLGSTFTASASSPVEINGPLDQKFFNAEVNEEKSFFDTLGELYQQGSVPDISKLLNVAWSGRCFKASAPSTPINSGYQMRVMKLPDVGPIGSDTKKFEAATYWDLNKAPNFFDGMPKSEVVNYVKVNFTEVKIVNKSLSFSDSSFRMSNKYIVEELGSGTKPSARCYYFLPEVR